MSYLAITFPHEAAGPAAQVLMNALRPLIGLGLVATMVMVFKPLIAGVLQALLLLLAPRQTRERRAADQRFQGVLALHRIARDFEATQPSQAAELRQLASRG
jgi:hypothetical protein